MKITIEHTNDNSIGIDINRATIELPDDSNIDEVIDSICGLLVAYGFHHNSVSSGIISKAEEYEDLQDKAE